VVFAAPPHNIPLIRIAARNAAIVSPACSRVPVAHFLPVARRVYEGRATPGSAPESLGLLDLFGKFSGHYV
jgi:hypothetical protein